MTFLSHGRVGTAALVLSIATADSIHAQRRAERVGDFSIEVTTDSVTSQDRSFATLWPWGEYFGNIDSGLFMVACGRDHAGLAGAVMLPAYGASGDSIAVELRLDEADPDTLMLDGIDGPFWYLRDSDVASVIASALKADSLFLETLDVLRRRERTRFAYGLQGLDSVMVRLGCEALPPASGQAAGRTTLNATTSQIVPRSAITYPHLENRRVVSQILDVRYPPEVWDSAAEREEVVVKFRILEDGSVDSTSIQVLRSTNDGLNQVASEAVRRACFSPPRAYDRPIKLWTELPFTFVRPSRRPAVQSENPPHSGCRPRAGTRVHTP
jgi:TonB family protein